MWGGMCICVLRVCIGVRVIYICVGVFVWGVRVCVLGGVYWGVCMECVSVSTDSGGGVGGMCMCVGVCV